MKGAIVDKGKAFADDLHQRLRQAYNELAQRNELGVIPESDPEVQALIDQVTDPTVPWYHYTDTADDFEHREGAMNPLTHFGTKKASEDRKEYFDIWSPRKRGGGNPRTIEASIQTKNPLFIRDNSLESPRDHYTGGIRTDYPADVYDVPLNDQTYLQKGDPEFQRPQGATGTRELTAKEVEDEIMKAGYDSLVYPNAAEDPGSLSIVPLGTDKVFDYDTGRKIRNVAATGGAIGAGTVLAPEEAEAGLPFHHVSNALFDIPKVLSIDDAKAVGGAGAQAFGPGFYGLQDPQGLEMYVNMLNRYKMQDNFSQFMPQGLSAHKQDMIYGGISAADDYITTGKFNDFDKKFVKEIVGQDTYGDPEAIATADRIMDSVNKITNVEPGLNKYTFDFDADPKQHLYNASSSPYDEDRVGWLDELKARLLPKSTPENQDDLYKQLQQVEDIDSSTYDNLNRRLTLAELQSNLQSDQAKYYDWPYLMEMLGNISSPERLLKALSEMDIRGNRHFDDVTGSPALVANMPEYLRKVDQTIMRPKYYGK